MNEQAQSIKAARASRKRMLRRRVATGAVTVFIASWAVIAGEVALGHNSALAAHTSTTSAGASTTSTGTSTTSTGASGSSGSGTASSQSSTSSGPSAVTTSQS